MKDGAMYTASVRSQNDNFKIAWARANRNPNRMMKEIFKGITRVVQMATLVGNQSERSKFHLNQSESRISPM